MKAKARYVAGQSHRDPPGERQAVDDRHRAEEGQRWRFILASGTSIVQLRLPTTIRRPGSYRVVWIVTAGTPQGVEDDQRLRLAEA